MSTDTESLYANLARRLSLSVDDLLRQIAARPDQLGVPDLPIGGRRMYR